MKENGIDIKIDNAAGRLNEVWHRLDLVCRRLWDEDSPSAVGLQALTEEFKGEVHRVEQLLAATQKTLQEQRHALSKEFEALYTEKVKGLENQIAHARE